MHPGKAHAVYRGADQSHTILCRIAAVQFSSALHLLGQQNRLAAGGSAQVQHRFTGGCAHTKGCQLAGLPLYMIVPLPEQLVVCRAARKTCQHTAGHNTLPHLCCALLCKQRAQLCSAGLEGVCAQTGQTAIGLIGQDAQCFIRVIFVEEFRHIPPGRAKHHQALDLVCKDGSVQIIAAGLAQHSVDKAGGAGFFKGAGQLDCLVHRSRDRNLHIASLCQCSA